MIPRDRRRVSTACSFQLVREWAVLAGVPHVPYDVRVTSLAGTVRRWVLWSFNYIMKVYKHREECDVVEQ